MKNELPEIMKAAQGLDAQALMAFAFKRFGNRMALATSLGAEDQVLTYMAAQVSKDFSIFTLDTGRLPQETYDILDQTRQKYGLSIRVLFPDTAKVEAMVNQHGVNLFYESVENRKMCCGVRKVEPLRKELATKEAWIVGLRAEQSVTRAELKHVDWDEANGLIKICPLADWTTEQVWDFIKAKKIPYNALHDQGYPSIGCAPCTRAVKPGEDIRAGRWWWESPDHKECGLHERRNRKK